MRVAKARAPVAEVGGDDEEGVGRGKVRREEGAEMAFGGGGDGADEDGDEADVPAVKEERGE